MGAAAQCDLVVMGAAVKAAPGFILPRKHCDLDPLKAPITMSAIIATADLVSIQTASISFKNSAQIFAATFMGLESRA